MGLRLDRPDTMFREYGASTSRTLAMLSARRQYFRKSDTQSEAARMTDGMNYQGRHELACTLANPRADDAPLVNKENAIASAASGRLRALHFYDILEPNELCLPLLTGTGNNDIRFPFPLMANTLLGLVMVRRDNGLEFGSVIWSSSRSLTSS